MAKGEHASFYPRDHSWNTWNARAFYQPGDYGFGAWLYSEEWSVRGKLAIAGTSLAIERYRLVHGSLPSRLDDLVPAFLDRVPADPYKRHGKPLSYRIRPSGAYVVYSCGRNGKDDSIKEPEKQDAGQTDDLTFTVAPPEAISHQLSAISHQPLTADR